MNSFDIFISHAWRPEEPWTRVVAMLDAEEGFEWRNFSVPWHDPAMRPGTPDGRAFIEKCLDAQVRSAHVVLFLSALYARKSARPWLDLQLEHARRLAIPVILVRSEDDSDPLETLLNSADTVVDWNSEAICSSISAAVSSGAPARGRRTLIGP